MRNFWNWMLVAAGGVLIIAEVIIGAATGFDLMLLGISLAAGGAIGLFFGSTQVGLFSSGALALVYFAFLRRFVRSHLSSPHKPSNVDAIVGRTGIVTVRVAPNEAGQVRVDGEVWRAVLSLSATGAIDPGQSVRVESIEGVTLTVR